MAPPWPRNKFQAHGWRTPRPDFGVWLRHRTSGRGCPARRDAGNSPRSSSPCESGGSCESGGRASWGGETKNAARPRSGDDPEQRDGGKARRVARRRMPREPGWRRPHTTGASKDLHREAGPLPASGCITRFKRAAGRLQGWMRRSSHAAVTPLASRRPPRPRRGGPGRSSARSRNGAWRCSAPPSGSRGAARTSRGTAAG